MTSEQFFPSRQSSYINPVFLQDPGWTSVSKVFNQDLQDKGQAELPERNDEVRKDSVGMPAGSTEDPEDGNTPADRLSISEADQITRVMGMGAAGSMGVTARAGFPRRIEGLHKGVQAVCRMIFL